MFNIGPAEVMVVLLIALLVLGPTKLPDAARQVGRALGQLRSLSAGFQAEMRDALKEPVDGKPSTAGSTAEGGGALSAPQAGTAGAPSGDVAPSGEGAPAGTGDIQAAGPVPVADGHADGQAPESRPVPDATREEPSAGAPARGAPGDAAEPGTKGTTPA